MRISRRLLTPFGQGGGSVLLEWLAAGQCHGGFLLFKHHRPDCSGDSSNLRQFIILP